MNRHPRAGTRRLLLLLSTTLIVLLIPAAAALAATVTKDGSNLVFTDASAEAQDLSVSQAGAIVTITDNNSNAVTSTDCTQVDPSTVDCDTSGITRLVFNLGGGGDVISVNVSVTIPQTTDGGDGDDCGGGNTGLWGSPATGDVIRGGAGDDCIFGDGPGGAEPGADDQLFGDAGVDFVAGSRGNDQVSGGDDADSVTGGPGNDTVGGDAGNDPFVAGGPGVDTVTGGDGSDFLAGNGCEPFCPLDQTDGADSLDGGPGLGDQVNYFGGPPGTPIPINVSLDGQPNDGASGEGDNVLNVEDIGVNGQGPVTFTGDASVNQFFGSAGNDTIDPGPNNDFVFGNDGDDTFNTRDGFLDRIQCGAGTDTANVDAQDLVDSDCEVVNRQDVGNANEDRPPSVAWTAPASGATLSTRVANVLQVTATDDRGISQVIFMDDERVVCTDTTAPYTCDYRPQGDDVGRNTLVAMAIDTSQQSATAVRNVRVGRFTPTLTASTTPRRDTRAPYRFTTSGRLRLPTGVTNAQGCSGFVSVQFKAGTKTVSSRRVSVSRSCTYRSRVSFSIRSRLRPSRLSVVVRYLGNEVLGADSAPRHTVRVRS